MNKKTIAVLLTILVCAFYAAGQRAEGDTARWLKARVAAALEGFPAETATARDALCAEILGLGPAAIAETFARVLPPGAGNDAKARFAVNALAVYVTRAGAETGRRRFVPSLLDALASTQDRNVASFLISQVQLAGKAEAVGPLARYLGDDALGGPAAAALQAIGGHEASRALLNALDAAPPSARLSIVDSLGAMRTREAVKRLLPLVDSGDEGLRRAARFALANIGDPAAAAILSKVRIDASYRERSEAPSIYLLFARRLAEAGRTREGLAAARAVFESHGGPGESQAASEALALIVSTLKDKAVPDLLSAADSPARDLRAAALELATTLGGKEATAQWIKKAAASAPEARAGIIVMLGRRGDAAALPFVRESLRSPERIVRLGRRPRRRPARRRDGHPRYRRA